MLGYGEIYRVWQSKVPFSESSLNTFWPLATFFVKTEKQNWIKPFVALYFSRKAFIILENLIWVWNALHHLCYSKFNIFVFNRNTKLDVANRIIIVPMIIVLVVGKWLETWKGFVCFLVLSKIPAILSVLNLSLYC
jgi:hypothetical protein